MAWSRPRIPCSGAGARSLAGGVGVVALVAGALAVVVVATASQAQAYVRKATSAGALYQWSAGRAAMTVRLFNVPGLTAEGVREGVSAAARAWTAEVPCTSMKLTLTFAAGDANATANDGVNFVGARPDGWCASGDPLPPAGQVGCNDPSAVAVTSVFADTVSGRILGADTQLNTLTMSWGVLDAASQPDDRQDLQSVLTHELGHVLGLEHPCWSGTGPRANDDTGAPVPDCYGAPAELVAETMFPSMTAGDVSRRVVSTDSRRAMCEIYPMSDSPTSDSPGDGGGCSIATATSLHGTGIASARRHVHDGTAALGFFLAGAMGVWVRRRTPLR